MFKANEETMLQDIMTLSEWNGALLLFLEEVNDETTINDFKSDFISTIDLTKINDNETLWSENGLAKEVEHAETGRVLLIHYHLTSSDLPWGFENNNVPLDIICFDINSDGSVNILKDLPYDMGSVNTVLVENLSLETFALNKEVVFESNGLSEANQLTPINLLSNPISEDESTEQWLTRVSFLLSHMLITVNNPKTVVSYRMIKALGNNNANILSLSASASVVTPYVVFAYPVDDDVARFWLPNQFSDIMSETEAISDGLVIGYNDEFFSGLYVKNNVISPLSEEEAENFKEGNILIGELEFKPDLMGVVDKNAELPEKSNLEELANELLDNEYTGISESKKVLPPKPAGMMDEVYDYMIANGLMS